MRSYYKDPAYNAAFERCIDVMANLIIKYGPSINISAPDGSPINWPVQEFCVGRDRERHTSAFKTRLQAYRSGIIHMPLKAAA